MELVNDHRSQRPTLLTIRIKYIPAPLLHAVSIHSNSASEYVIKLFRVVPKRMRVGDFKGYLSLVADPHNQALLPEEGVSSDE